MSDFRENPLINAPHDWWKGWTILRERRRKAIDQITQDLQNAEVFQNDRVINQDIDKRTQEQILKPGLQATAGVVFPILGFDLGASLGTSAGAFTDFAVYEKIAHFPLPVGIAFLALSALSGASIGLLTSLALTPQAFAGRSERPQISG